MAAKAGRAENRHAINPPHRVTSIGRSAMTRPKNKNKRRSYKKYRGQG